MSDEYNPVTAEDVEEWADEVGFDADDVANFAASVQLGQLMINAMSTGGLSDESQMRADDVYEALYEASSLDEDSDFPEPVEQYIPRMAFAKHVDEVRD